MLHLYPLFLIDGFWLPFNLENVKYVVDVHSDGVYYYICACRVHIVRCFRMRLKLKVVDIKIPSDIP